MSKQFDALLDFWAKNHMNVILEGSHGFGKTAVVEEAFNRQGWKWKYFSAATMDPWVDLVGVPKEHTDENGQPHLKLIRPKEFQNDEYDAIFFDEFNRCVAGDTKIPLTNGNNVPIKDLVGLEEFFVYAFDNKDRRIKVARGHSARLTSRTEEKLLKITLDNGYAFKCTIDHPLLKYDGTFVRADALKVDDSMLPLYRIWDGNRKTTKGYEMVWQPKKNSKWELTYRMADAFNLRHGVYDDVPGFHRHHIDNNKNNNSPRNLIQLSMVDHFDTHRNDNVSSSAAGRMSHVIHPDLVSRTIGLLENSTKGRRASAETRKTCPEFKKKRSMASQQMYTPELRSYRSDVTKNQWQSGQFKAIDRTSALRKNHVMRTVNMLLKHRVDISTLEEKDYETIRKEVATGGQGVYITKLSKALEWFGTFAVFRDKLVELSAQKINGNHRITSIEDCIPEPVYDITVDEYENFAIEGGIFVHNSPKKVRNAVMELIQFKSINGHKFNNLKVVWAAINPHDEEETYDVEKLDPAQVDRFHVLYEVPSVPDKDFFYATYGVDMGKAAIEWWSAIPDKARKLVSARRLQYVLDCYRAGGDIKYLVHKSTLPSKLLMVLNSGSLIEKLKAILAAKDDKALRTFLKKDNHFDVAVDLMKNDFNAIEAIVPFVDEERLMRLTHDIRSVREFVTHPDNVDKHADMLRAVLNAGTLGDKEETRLRAVLSRGVTSDKHGVVTYQPRPEMATSSQAETYDTIRSWTTILATADSAELLKAYDFINLNLCEPPTTNDAINALCVLFRFIDREKHDMLVTRYTKLIPMLNYIISDLTSKNVNVNDVRVKSQFSQGNRKLRSIVKVQGFLDGQHESLVVKPRIM